MAQIVKLRGIHGEEDIVKGKNGRDVKIMFTPGVATLVVMDDYNKIYAVYPDHAYVKAWMEEEG